MINIWNHSAKAFYGWRKEEAIGRVSHDLLQTEFPKPLEEIESELARRGRWEGELVHTTRDGRRVTVRSEWLLDASGQPGMVVERNAHSTGGAKDGKARSRATLFANVTLGAGVCACVAAFSYCVYFYGVAGTKSFSSFAGVFFYQILPAALALLLLTAFRLPPAHRVNLALVLCSIGVSLYSAELLQGVSASMFSSSSSKTLWGDPHFEEEKKEIRAVARQFNSEFDTRSRLEMIRDLRRQGIPAVPSIAPIELLKKQADGRFESEITMTISGETILPLGGISNRAAVLCNETGRYLIYDSDERGFHNPRGIWKSKSITVAGVGDSFTEGSCVPSDRNFMALIRNRYPQTLNLGMSGEGPLFMLAAITEYLPILKPKVVLWFFYEENDFAELFKESKSPLLIQYAEGKFNQGLFDRQPEIDQALMQYVEKEMANRSEEAQVEKVGWYYPQKLVHFLKLDRLRGTLGLVYGRVVQPSEAWYGQSQMDLFRTILLQAKRSVEEWGGTLYFVYLPARDRYANGQDYHRQALMDVVEKTGIPIVDVHTAFQRESDPLGFFPFRRFGHYNEEGNRVVAEEVLRVISTKN